MNLLAHFYLADLTGTSAAGQLLGDQIKGRLTGRLGADIERGIRLHRAIDSFTDHHPLTAELRRDFEPPLRRYGGILVDIGFDYCLTRDWAHYSDVPLAEFAQLAVERTRREWPAMAAPAPGIGLAEVLASYDQTHGLQRALDSVDRRLRRPSPLPDALPALLARRTQLQQAFAAFFPELCDHAGRVQ